MDMAALHRKQTSSCRGQERDRGSRGRDSRCWRKEESNAPGHQEQQTEKGSNGRRLPDNLKVKPSDQETAKSREHPASLARKCVDRCK